MTLIKNPKRNKITRLLGSIITLHKFEPISFEEFLGKCEYFTVHKYEIKKENSLYVDEKSLQCVTCIKGNGVTDSNERREGDSFFVLAYYGQYKLQGNVEVLITKL